MKGRGELQKKVVTGRAVPGTGTGSRSGLGACLTAGAVCRCAPYAVRQTSTSVPTQVIAWPYRPYGWRVLSLAKASASHATRSGAVKTGGGIAVHIVCMYYVRYLDTSADNATLLSGVPPDGHRLRAVLATAGRPVSVSACLARQPPSRGLRCPDSYLSTMDALIGHSTPCEPWSAFQTFVH